MNDDKISVFRISLNITSNIEISFALYASAQCFGEKPGIFKYTNDE